MLADIAGGRDMRATGSGRGRKEWKRLTGAFGTAVEALRMGDLRIEVGKGVVVEQLSGVEVKDGVCQKCMTIHALRPVLGECARMPRGPGSGRDCAQAAGVRGQLWARHLDLNASYSHN